MKLSAGILPFRFRFPDGRVGTVPVPDVNSWQIEVLLCHPGGPFYRRRQYGVWSIPKGEVAPGEDPLYRALRELWEETGITPEGPFLWLGRVRYPSARKIVMAWACPYGGEPPSGHVPPQVTVKVRGRPLTFPEVDRVAWLTVDQARAYILPAQAPLLDRLIDRVAVPVAAGASGGAPRD